MANRSIPSIGLLRQALGIAEQVEKLEARLASILRRVPAAMSGAKARVASVVAAGGRKRRKPRFSAAARAKISAAQRRRWAKVRKAKAGK